MCEPTLFNNNTSKIIWNFAAAPGIQYCGKITLFFWFCLIWEQRKMFGMQSNDRCNVIVPIGTEIGLFSFMVTYLPTYVQYFKDCWHYRM